MWASVEALPGFAGALISGCGGCPAPAQLRRGHGGLGIKTRVSSSCPICPDRAWASSSHRLSPPRGCNSPTGWLMEYFSIIISFILGEGCGWEVKCETRAGWQVRAVTVPRVGAQSLGGGARQGGRAGPGLSKSQRPGSHSDVPRGTSGSLECPCEHPVGPGSCEEGLGPTEA